MRSESRSLRGRRTADGRVRRQRHRERRPRRDEYRHDIAAAGARHREPRSTRRGAYPTKPRPPIGTAGNPAAGALVQAQQMPTSSSAVDVDESLITPYLESFYVLDSPTAWLNWTGTGCGRRRSTRFRQRFASPGGDGQSCDGPCGVALRRSGCCRSASTDITRPHCRLDRGSIPTSRDPRHPKPQPPATRSLRGLHRVHHDPIVQPARPYVFMEFAQSVHGFDPAAALSRRPSKARSGDRPVQAATSAHSRPSR